MQSCYKLRDACAFFPYDGQATEHSFVLKTPDHRQFKVSATAREILLQLDGRTALEAVAANLNSRSISISQEELETLVRTQYAPLGIFEQRDGPASEARIESKVRLPFLLHWDLIPERYVQAASNPLAHLLAKPVVLVALAAIVTAHATVYFRFSAAQYLSNASFLGILGLCLASVLWHELGHSSAVARYGGRPGKIGFGLFVLLPSFYADVSEIWRFTRKQRMVVDLGGIYFQQLFFCISALLGSLTSKPEFFITCRFIDLMVFLTLNPVVRFDGYWLLADWLALPNLYRLAVGYLSGAVKRVFRHGERIPLPSMPRRTYVVFVGYAIVSNLFLLAVLWMSYRYVASIFRTIPTVLPTTFEAMMFALKTHDLTSFLSRLLVLFFAIAFPVTALVGIYKYGAIFFQFLVRKVQFAAVAQRQSRSEASGVTLRGSE